MRRIRSYMLLLTICMLATQHAYGQGTPGVLKCIFNGTVELRAQPYNSGPVIARIACGESIIFLDQQYRSPHVRTTAGKHGYITGFNGGQWWVTTDVAPSPTPASATVTAFGAPAQQTAPPLRTAPALQTTPAQQTAPVVAFYKDGVGPIRISAQVNVNNSLATLISTAMNDSGEDIQYTKFCVSPLGNKNCSFELMTTGVWRAGEEWNWSLTGPALGGIDKPVVALVELRKEPAPVLWKAYAARNGISVFTRRYAQGPRAGRLFLNESVDVIEQTAPWTRIRTKTFGGFVQSSELSRNKVEAPRSEVASKASSGSEVASRAPSGSEVASRAPSGSEVASKAPSGSEVAPKAPSAWEAVLQGLVAGLASNASPAQKGKLMIFGGPNRATYLGCLNCSENADESVFNPDGKGNVHSKESIWNRSADFGSEDSRYSACNPYAGEPPVIIGDSGNLQGRLTLNTYHPDLGEGAEWIGWLLNAVCK